MPRAKHPLPFEMKGIRTDPETGRYVLSENGITYYMNLGHTRLLKEYYRGNGGGTTIEKWYNDLDRFTRKDIRLVGPKRNEESDFYPDISYE